MKEFIKNEQELFICEECEKISGSKENLSKHIGIFHNKREYFDKWLKENNEGLCKVCGKETKFINIGQGYKNCCSRQCGYDWNHIQIDKSILEKYDVTNISKLENIKIKKVKTCLLHYGVKYGTQSKEIKEKTIQTCLKRYGVESVNQDPEIHEKQQKAAFKAKNYKNTNLYYRGSYELDFLEKFYNKYLDIQNGPPIKYKLNNKFRIYFSDFYIPSLNLIIEIKSLYYYKKFKNQCTQKAHATIAKGFKYLMILEKNYFACNL